MEENKQILDINYHVFNGLNLYNEELGQSYIQTGFNPLGENFVLSESFITDALQNSNNAKEVNSPEFIQLGEKATKVAFENSLTSCEALLGSLLVKLGSGELSKEAKSKLQKLILYLQMRIELLKNFIAKLKTEKNKLKMYESLLALNWSLADLMEETFKEMCDIQLVLNGMTSLFKDSLSVENDYEKSKLIEQAKQIIAQNLRNQEMAQNHTATSEIIDNPYIEELKNFNNQPKPTKKEQTTKQSSENNVHKQEESRDL